MNETFFTVLRHGETCENQAGILQGQLPGHLNEAGRLQACRAADFLSREHFDLLFSSDLERAMETASIVGKVLHLPVQPCSMLREWHLGKLEGRHREDLWKLYPEIMDCFSFDFDHEVEVPGGESRNIFFARVGAGLNCLAHDHPGKRILLVTHCGTLRAIYRHVAGRISSGRMMPRTTNASCSRFVFQNGLWQLVSWNESSYLNGLSVRESTTF